MSQTAASSFVSLLVFPHVNPNVFPFAYVVKFVFHPFLTLSFSFTFFLLLSVHPAPPSRCDYSNFSSDEAGTVLMHDYYMKLYKGSSSVISNTLNQDAL